MTTITITIGSNGIHRVAVLDVEDMQINVKDKQIEDYELLRKIDLLVDKFNKDEVKKA